MKLHLLMIMLLSCVISVPGMAASLCADFSAVTCPDPGIEAGMDAERHMGGDWMCTQNNKNLPVELIGMCSSTNGSTQGAESSRLSFSSSGNDNTHCWCKMITPAVSQWVYHSDLDSGGGTDWNPDTNETIYHGFGSCWVYCASYCVGTFVNDPIFRYHFFNSLEYD